MLSSRLYIHKKTSKNLLNDKRLFCTTHYGSTQLVEDSLKHNKTIDNKKFAQGLS